MSGKRKLVNAPQKHEQQEVQVKEVTKEITPKKKKNVPAKNK